MAEHTPVDPFEERLRGLVRTYTQPAADPVDHLATARAAMTAPVGRRVPLERAWPLAIDRRLIPILVVAVLVLGVLALALAGGSPPQPPVDTTPRLAFIRDGDLFLSAIDGTDATMLRDGGADNASLGYMSVLWSPDMRSIAAVRDIGGGVLTPAIDILEQDGTVRRTIDLGPGGMPSISWSPDGTELAIASYPGDVNSNPVEPIIVAPRLTIAGRDVGSREIELPAEAEISADPFVGQDPEYRVRWSPDGRWIAVAWDDFAGSFHLVGVDGRIIPQEIDQENNECSFSRTVVDWFPDGRRLATSGWMDTLCVETIGRDGRLDGPTLTVDTAAPDEAGRHEKLVVPAVSPDGGRIAVVTWVDDVALTPTDAIDRGTHTSTLRVYDLATGAATDVASGVQALLVEADGTGHWDETLDGAPVGEGGLAWTGDGRQLLYLSPETWDRPTSWSIRAVDAAGGGESRIVAEGVRSFDVGSSH